MKFSAYSPGYSPFPIVLVPECMQPSFRTREAVDLVVRLGAIEIPAAAIRAMADAALCDPDLHEYVVTSPKFALWLHALLSSDSERTAA